MEIDRDASETDVLSKFVARIMRIQQKLLKKYHEDELLRDQLMSAIDSPPIRQSLRERITKNTHETISRAASMTSDKSRTAGSSSAHYTDFQNVENLSCKEISGSTM